MHLQGGQTACQIGPVHGDAPVEAAGTQQRLVQHLGPVGGAQHDDALAGVEAVQLRQQLVQRLLPLVVAAEAAGVTGLADGVDLVDENDAGGNLGGLLEQVTDTAGADAHKHLHKVRAGDREEGHARFAGHGLGQQRLTGTGRAHQQRALGQLGADGGVLAGIVQEVDDLRQRLLGLVLTGHVLEGDAGGFFHIDLGVGLAHVADAAEPAAAGFAEETHDQHEQAHHDDGRQDIADHEHQHRVHLGLIVAGVGHIVLLQQRQQLVVGQVRGVQRQVGLFGLGVGLGRLLAALLDLLRIGIAVHRSDIDGLILELDLLDLVLFHHLHHLAVLDLVAGGLVGGIAGIGADVIHRHRQHHRPGNQRHNTAHPVAVFVVFVVAVVIICHITLLERADILIMYECQYTT